MNLLKLTRYYSESSCTGGPVYVNPEHIALVERETWAKAFTRIELVGGTRLSVLEDPDTIMERARYIALEGVS